MSRLGLALADAARNCTRQGAKATITLCSGVQYTGKLERSAVDNGTAHLQLEHGGWVTIGEDEIAAVESRP